jgi:putative ABC transport system permease protein
MYYIALRMLFGDKAKYMLLIAALTFASLLITQQASVFCGIMRWSTATLRNSFAPIWVVDPMVENCNESNPLRDVDLFRVRSVDGVQWAMPVAYNIIAAHLRVGEFKSIMLFGLDSSTLAGAPRHMIAGHLEDLLGAQTVIVDEFGIERLSEGSPKRLQVGDSFQINDIEARIVGICRTERSFFSYPFVYTTYPHFQRFIPPQRKELSAVIAGPQNGKTVEQVARSIEKATNLGPIPLKNFFGRPFGGCFEIQVFPSLWAPQSF